MIFELTLSILIFGGSNRGKMSSNCPNGHLRLHAQNAQVILWLCFEMLVMQNLLKSAADVSKSDSPYHTSGQDVLL